MPSLKETYYTLTWGEYEDRIDFYETLKQAKLAAKKLFAGVPHKITKHTEQQLYSGVV